MTRNNALPEKNKTGKPRPVGDDIAEKQVDKSRGTFDDALGRVTEPLAAEPSRRGRGSPRKSAGRRRER